MEAKQNSISKFMDQSDARFYIPVYQRNYDWRIEQCNQLLKDILTVGKNSNIDSHFIGSIVYIQLNFITGAPELTIIDGQQRLTTLTLFLAALSKRASENSRLDFAKKIIKKYLINEDMNDSEKLKLKPIKKDDKALNYILGIYHQEINEYSRIIENFNFFYENITVDKIDLALEGFKKLIFIEIGLDRQKDDPQKIFQSLNSTGLDLSQADLIRNYILMGQNHRTQTKIYERYWIEIENNTTENNSKINRMSDFIRDYLTFKFSSIPNMNKVFEVFKDKFQFNDEIELTNLLEEIKLYSKFYNYFINPEGSTNEAIKTNLRLIKKLQINVSYPFLLQVFKAFNDKKINESILNEVLEITQSFTWRRFICGVATNALNKIFMDLYKSIDEDNFILSLQKALVVKKGSQRFPNDEEVLRELKFKDMYNIQPKNRTYFLERLENYGHRIQTTIEDNSDVSIEHIFPQRPNPEWREKLGVQFEEMKSYINTAANLTLSAFNSELSNFYFTVKRDLPDKGYKASPLRIDKFLGEIDEWNLQTMELRRNWIEKRFFEIWKYPDIEIESTEESFEANILDLKESDVTNKEIVSFVFMKNTYYNTTWKELLRIVATIMFNNEPEQFFEDKMSKYLKLTTDPKQLNSSIQISSTYFIEGWFSAYFLMRRVQSILEKCETDDDLIVILK